MIDPRGLNMAGLFVSSAICIALFKSAFKKKPAEIIVLDLKECSEKKQ
jgi:hypothetical protein